MTTTPGVVPPPGPDAGTRVRAVRHRYARRDGRPPVRGRSFAGYVLALFAVAYLVPAVHLAGASPPPVAVEPSAAAAPVACALAATACWAAQLAGRFWGPLVLPPFLLHVFTSTDLSPTSYLGAVARRRLACAATATLLTTCAAAYLATDLFHRLGTALPALAVAVGISVVTAVAWLWGQVRAVPANVALASAAAAVALLVTLTSRAVPVGGGGGLWLVAGALAAAAVPLGRTAFRSVRTIDLTRLARDSARASQARTYTVTGTLHHALDLYRPEPRGFTSALLRPDGRLRGHLTQGAVRALRTPGRAAAAATTLLIGGALLTAGAAGPASLLWAAGSLCVYWGSGWVGETWRGLRDELTLAPLLGGRGGGTPARTLAWPVVAVAATACLGGGLALAASWPPAGGHLTDTILLGAGSVALVLGARFLREMKSHLPPELLDPLVTPFGDLAGLRVLAWQFDGVLAVVLGVAVMDAAPSAPGAATLALGVSACCVWTGLRRTGRAHRGLLARLTRR